MIIPTMTKKACWCGERLTAVLVTVAGKRLAVVPTDVQAAHVHRTGVIEP